MEFKTWYTQHEKLTLKSVVIDLDKIFVKEYILKGTICQPEEIYEMQDSDEEQE